MTEYKKVSTELIKKLKNIVQERHIIYQERDKLDKYALDEVADPEYAQKPEVVIKPDSAQQISKIMQLANKYKVPVTPRGGGTGLSGGAVPIYRGIVLSLERMNTILEIDEKNMMATVEPGVITSEINDQIKNKGLFYAGYPMSEESCFIGGNVAENAGGGRAVKYGVTGRYIMGLEVVTPEGEIIELGGKTVKDVVGYDLIDLMVGSEGTLGIFTKIILKLVPLPNKKVNLLTLFENIDTAIHLVPKILQKGKIIPTAIEFMDKKSILKVYDYLNEQLPLKGAEAALLIEIEGSDDEQMRDAYENIGDLCNDNGALEVYVADNSSTRKRVWNLRRNIPEAIQTFSYTKSSEDIVVPIANISELLKSIRKIDDQIELEIFCFGHAGDGNIHSTIVKPPTMDQKEWKYRVKDVRQKLFDKTIQLGGTISGEHGIGHKRKNYLKDIVDSNIIKLMKRIKSSFDPNNIVNPGKIFDLD